MLLVILLNNFIFFMLFISAVRDPPTVACLAETQEQITRVRYGDFELSCILPVGRGPNP